MIRNRWLTAGLALLGVLAGGRIQAGQNEISLQVGQLFFEGDSALDDNTVLGVRLGHYMTNKLEIEGSFFGGRFDQINPSGVNDRVDIVLPMIGLNYDLAGTKLVPFVEAAAGAMKYMPDKTGSSLHFAAQAGGGLKWHFHPSLAARMDLLYLIDTEAGQGTNNALASAGLSWFFGNWAVCPISPVPQVLDSDGDGVPNNLDKCPGTPTGVRVDGNGCPPDADGDGVPDDLDKCSDTPSGAAVDTNGCPIDSDGDGAPDYQDDCPNTPKGVVVDANGCPVGAKAVPEKEWVLGDIHFESNSDVINPKSYPKLDEVSEILTTHSKVKVEVQGHSDNTGNSAYNLKLSERRAQAVRNYLLHKGVGADRLEAKGYGDTLPLTDNKTKEGRAKNRRIQFRVISR